MPTTRQDVPWPASDFLRHSVSCFVTRCVIIEDAVHRPHDTLRVFAVPLDLSSEERAGRGAARPVALAEDLGTAGDITSRALIPADMQGTVNVVARTDGVLAGSPVARARVREARPGGDLEGARRGRFAFDAGDRRRRGCRAAAVAAFPASGRPEFSDALERCRHADAASSSTRWPGRRP